MKQIKFDELLQHSKDVKLTKKEKGMIDRWIRSVQQGRATLWDCYKTPSPRKEQAYQHCIERMRRQEGVLGTVVGHSAFEFSFGYIIYVPSHNKFYLYYETACSSYRIQLPAEFLFKAYNIPALKAGIEEAVKKSMGEELQIDWE